MVWFRNSRLHIRCGILDIGIHSSGVLRRWMNHQTIVRFYWILFRYLSIRLCMLCVRDLYLNPMRTSKMANMSVVHTHTGNVEVCFCHVTHEVQNYESPIKNMHMSCKLALCHPKQLLASMIKIFLLENANIVSTHKITMTNKNSKRWMNPNSS